MGICNQVLKFSRTGFLPILYFGMTVTSTGTWHNIVPEKSCKSYGNLCLLSWPAISTFFSAKMTMGIGNAVEFLLKNYTA